MAPVSATDDDLAASEERDNCGPGQLRSAYCWGRCSTSMSLLSLRMGAGDVPFLSGTNGPLWGTRKAQSMPADLTRDIKKHGDRQPICMRMGVEEVAAGEGSRSKIGHTPLSVDERSDLGSPR